MNLEGKVALVTGSSQGIGQGIVLHLAQAGANVIINYRSHPEGAEETLAKAVGLCGVSAGSFGGTRSTSAIFGIKP